MAKDKNKNKNSEEELKDKTSTETTNNAGKVSNEEGVKEEKKEVAEQPVAKKPTSFVVWLKNTTYVSATERMNAGIYPMQSVPERLVLAAKKNKKDCEIFEGGVPSRTLTEMADWAGIKNHRDLEDAELLAKLLSTPQSFA